MTDDPRAFDDPLLDWALSVREQIATLRALLREADRRALDADERAAVAELAKACAELTDAVRMLLRP